MAPQKEVVLKLTSMRYRKPGVSEEAFHEHARAHGPKAAAIQARHGALRVSHYHTPSSTRALLQQSLPWTIRPGFNIADHDITISVWVRTPETMTAIVMDPDFQALVGADNEMQDGERGTVDMGWEEVYVEDGRVVNVGEGGESEYPPYGIAKDVARGEVGNEGGAEKVIDF